MENFFNQLLLSIEKEESLFYYQSLSLELITLNRNKYIKSGNSNWELSFKEYKLATIVELFELIKKSLKECLKKFSPEKSLLLFLVYTTEKEILSFLEKRLSDKKTSSTKLQFLEAVKQTIETEVLKVFEEDAKDYVSFYAWNNDEEKDEYIQISYTSIISWITGRQQEFATLSIRNESKVRRALNALNNEQGLLTHFNANLDQESFDLLQIFNGIILKEKLKNTPHIEHLVAVLSWLRLNQYISAESTEFVEWLDFIGITQYAKFRKRNLWNKVINEYWIKDILKRNDCDLRAFFAVTAA